MSSTVFVSGVTLTQAGWFQDVDNVAYQYLSGVAGNTTTITAVGPAGLGAYAAGLKFRFIPVNTNTGATTINITGTVALGARNIFYNGAACVGGELQLGIPVEIVDDGTRFHIISIAASRGTFLPSLGGTTTYNAQSGDYTKLDRLIHVRGTVSVNLLGTGSVSTISGLPFTSGSTAGTFLGVTNFVSLAISVVSLYGSVNAGASTIQMRGLTVGATSDNQLSVFGNGTILNFAGTYFT